MATLQVRSIDDRLYEALGKKAAQKNRSISQEVMAILREYLSRPAHVRNATEQFLELCGSWQDERSTTEIATEIRKSRQASTRFKEIF